MNLSKLLEKLSYTLVSGSVETQVESLTSDSRKVRENTAFVCIVGAVSDGRHIYSGGSRTEGFRDCGTAGL